MFFLDNISFLLGSNFGHNIRVVNTCQTSEYNKHMNTIETVIQQTHEYYRNRNTTNT